MAFMKKKFKYFVLAAVVLLVSSSLFMLIGIYPIPRICPKSSTREYHARPRYSYGSIDPCHTVNSVYGVVEMMWITITFNPNYHFEWLHYEFGFPLKTMIWGTKPSHPPVIYHNNPPPEKVMTKIDLKNKPEGADSTYLSAARKAAKLCGDNIGLKQYLPMVIENSVIGLRIENPSYYFTPGTCYNKNISSHDTFVSYSYEYITVDYNSDTKEVGEPYPVLLNDKTINPVDVSKWRISADKAMETVLKNGGQDSLDRGLKLDEFLLDSRGWKIMFVGHGYPFGGFNSAFGAYRETYTVNMETGEFNGKVFTGRQG
jgi:hypothetical protein